MELRLHRPDVERESDIDTQAWDQIHPIGWLLPVRAGGGVKMLPSGLPKTDARVIFTSPLTAIDRIVDVQVGNRDYTHADLVRRSNDASRPSRAQSSKQAARHSTRSAKAPADRGASTQRINVSSGAA